MAKRILYDAVIHPLLARELAMAGYTQLQISQRIGFTNKGSKSIQNWFASYPEFRSAWEDGRNNRIIEFENSLERLCKTHYLTKTETFEKDGVIYKKTVVQEVDPSSHALMNYLRNKCPEKWMKPSCDAMGDLKNKAIEILDEDKGL
jgi:hypothetical protein